MGDRWRMQVETRVRGIDDSYLCHVLADTFSHSLTNILHGLFSFDYNLIKLSVAAGCTFNYMEIHHFKVFDMCGGKVPVMRRCKIFLWGPPFKVSEKIENV